MSRLSGARARLCLFATLFVLLSSRATLVLHEVVGHGLTATAFGARITGLYMFVFAGGRVSYAFPDDGDRGRLATSLGGIALELVLGLGALFAARRARPGTAARFSLVTFFAIDAAHAALYLARGAHYGYGDGALLASRVGVGARTAIVIGASAIAVTVAAVAGARLGAIAAGWIVGSPRGAVLALFGAFIVALAVQAGLALAELRLFPDPAYASIMEDRATAAAKREVARRLAEARRRGEDLPTEEARRRMIAELARARRPWPLDPPLGIAFVSALAIGARRGARRPEGTAGEPSWRSIRAAGVGLAVSLALIAASRALPSQPSRRVAGGLAQLPLQRTLLPSTFAQAAAPPQIWSHAHAAPPSHAAGTSRQPSTTGPHVGERHPGCPLQSAGVVPGGQVGRGTQRSFSVHSRYAHTRDSSHRSLPHFVPDASAPASSGGSPIVMHAGDAASAVRSATPSATAPRPRAETNMLGV